MIYLIGIVAIIVFIALIGALGRSDKQYAAAQASADFERRMASRVVAYRDYLRREGDESWQKLSDHELEDLIGNAIRGLAADFREARGLAKAVFWVPGAVFTIIVVYNIESWRQSLTEMGPLLVIGIWIAIVFGSGFVAALAVAYWRDTAIARKWTRAGWDINRLSV
ncbi:hypothetical protein [Roseovarius sp.]|uniref:hypothetical protein n=1 Tax=Roseovarius sp. TaxID=1486281 RepID=UPI003BA899D8